VTGEPSSSARDEGRCGLPSLPEATKATLFCQREADHLGPHRVYGGDGEPIREWQRALCQFCGRTREEHDPNPLIDCPGGEGSRAIATLVRGHRYDCDCASCVELRTNLAAIAEAEREAWRRSRDIVL
jgi:hypothetical protein